MADTRIEKDLLGEREIPMTVYWGIHTLRALENFPITGRPISTNAHLGRGLAAVKWAAASATWAAVAASCACFNAASTCARALSAASRVIAAGS